jgi:hypothetical protein
MMMTAAPMPGGGRSPNFVLLGKIKALRNGLNFRKFFPEDLKLGHDLQRTLRGGGNIIARPK